MKELELPNINEEELLNLANIVQEALTKIETNNVGYYHVDSGYIPIYNIDLDSLTSSVLGLTDPIGQLRDWLTNTINSIANWIVQQITNVVNTIKDVVSSIIESAMDSIQSLFRNIYDALQEIGNALNEVVVKPITEALEVAKDFISNLPSYISNFIDTLRTTLETVADYINNYVLQPISQTFQRAIEQITDFIANISSVIEQSLSKVGEFVTNLIDRISSTLSQIPSIITSIINRIGKTLESIVGNITEIGTQILNWLRGGIENLLQYITEGFQSIKGGFDWLIQQIQNLGKQIYNVILNVPKYLEDMIKGIEQRISRIGGFLEGVWNKIVSGVEWVVKQVETLSSQILSRIIDGLTWLWNQIQNIGKGILTFLENIPKYVEEGIKWVITQIENIGREIYSLLENVWNKIVSGVEWLAQQIASRLEIIPEFISKIVNAISEIPNYLSKVTDILNKTFENIFKNITQLGKTIENILNMLSPTKVGETLKELVGDVTKFIWEHLPKEFKDAITSVVDWVKSLVNVPKYLFTYLEAKLKKDYPQLIQEWEGFLKTHPTPVDILKDLPTFTVLVFKSSGAIAWELMPETIKDFFKNLADSIKSIGELLDIKDWLKDFIDWIAKGMDWLRQIITNALQEFSSWVWNGFNTFLTIVKAGLSTVGEWVVGGVSELVKVIVSVIKGSLQGINNVVNIAFGWFFKEIVSGLEKYQEEVIKKILSKEKVGEFSIIYNFLSFLTPVLFSGVLIAEVIPTLLKIVSAIRAKISPLGVGGDIKIDIKAIAESLEKLLGRIMPDVIKYISIGSAIWWFEPTRVFTRYFLTEQLTIELPPVGESLEAYRRYIVKESLTTLYDFLETQLRMGGIGVSFIKLLYAVSKDLDKYIKTEYQKSDRIFTGGAVGVKPPTFNEAMKALEIYDRFNNPRYVPTSLIFRIPSPSELARWLVRDVFITPSHYERVVGMLGYTPDFAKMQYMYSFEYPPPEKIWKFVMRGISGLLWFTPPKEMVQVFNQEADWLGAGRPLPPVSLNFKGDTLLKALNWYMKWRQYSNFSWFKSQVRRYGFDFTADSWLVLDVTADIPTKIDVRWMGRWGIFQVMSDVGITTTTPSTEFIKNMLTTVQKYGKNPLVYMDLTMMCRLLQATGLHPHYVPIVAVAEIMNTLTDERTLLRTGFINLYREGLWDISTLDKLLSGFVVTTFKISYYDLDNYQWKEGEFSIPVMYLPPERKLLELRATFDKALRLTRRLLTGLFYGVRNFIIDTNKALDNLKTLVNQINTSFFMNVVKEITGKELALQLEEGWVKSFLTLGELLSNIYAIGRARGYARYLLWSVIRFVREGYMTLDKGLEFVNEYVEKVHEHPIVKDFLTYVFHRVHDVFRIEIRARAILNQLRSRRIDFNKAVEELASLGFDRDLINDYIYANVRFYHPSLTQYGTLLEIVPEALNMSLKAILNFNLPQEELKYWLLYIARKPFSDELTLIRTRIYNLLGYGESPENIVTFLKDYLVNIEIRDAQVAFSYGPKAKEVLKIYEANKEVFEAFGITPMEWVLYNLIGAMEFRERALREAGRERVPPPSTLAEFVEYLNISEEVVRKALYEYGIASEWINYYVKYIFVRSIANDVRRLLTYMVRAKAIGLVTDTEWKDFEKLLEAIGYNASELRIVEQWVNVEERIYLGRQYLPTPLTLATLAEYIKIPPELIQEVFTRRRVPTEWASLWLQYIKIRPLADNVRAVLRRFTYYLAVSLKVDTKIENLVKKYALVINFTETEWNLLKLEALIERYARGARYALPSPLTLARMYSIMEEVNTWLETAIEFYRIPKNVADYIKTYAVRYAIRYDLRRLITVSVRLFEYFAIDKKTLNNILNELKTYGLVSARLELILKEADLRRSYRAYRNLLGSPRTLVTMAEYVPSARDVAIKKVHEMIDALPIDQRTKDLLKKMWEDFIRIRPVYNEVRRYVTELISDYAYGVIDMGTLKRELNELKKWGLDDYEIQFYIWLAERRKERYKAREEKGISGWYYGYLP